MSYIGNTAQNQSYAPGIDYFSGNGSTVAFTLSRPVNVAAQMLVFVANVPQNPSTAFTVSGNTITFTSAPPAGTNNIWVEYTSLITNLIAPGQGTVGTAQLAATGTPDSTTFLRGDNTWQTLAVTPAGISGQANTATSYLDLPKGTTAQRPASPQPGNMRYNTTTNQTEIYNGVGWTVVTNQVYSFDYVMVAGGGGGGSGYGPGGGGAGGLLSAASVTAYPGDSYAFVVGAGGAGGTGGVHTNMSGTTGSNTTGFSLTALGGGGGGSGNSDDVDGYVNGKSGGSGGGGGYYSTNSGTGNPGNHPGGSGTSGQGYAGGNGSYTAASSSQAGGGGGGAGAAGAGVSANQAGAGGVGYQWSNGSYYAGGGGGGCGQGGTAGAAGGGGNGGGGGGSTNGAGTSGTTNTGGGGGGGASGTASTNGGNGGSGVVIVRYSGSQKGTGGTVTSSGGYTYHTFTSSGTFTA